MQTRNEEPLMRPQSARSKLFWAALICGCLGLAGAAGYRVGMARQSSGWSMGVQQKVPFEFYLTEQSFSEIVNTRARIEALSIQFLTELRARHDASALGSSAASHLGNPLYVVQPGRAIDEIQKGMEEFKGTGQEMSLVQELLMLLKNQKFSERWLDVYLATLYEHPTHPLIGRNAKHAVAISDGLGRQEELARAFDFLRRIPLDYPAKEKVQAALQNANVARLDSPAGVALALHVFTETRDQQARQ
jgi:hypothetical protein